MTTRLALATALLALACVGCAPSTEVSASDAEKNKQAFSQGAYEDAMRKAGKGAELDEEKARAAARNAGGQEEGQR